MSNFKIDIQYIKQSKKIIDQHHNIISKLDQFQQRLDQAKLDMMGYKSELDNIEKSSDDELLKQQQLFDLMDKYDTEMSKIQTDMMPYINQMDQIKKDSEILYKTIKDKYPGVEDKVLQQTIFDQINQLKDQN